MSDRPRIPARPTIYKGTQMRSRLEARFAGVLDGFGVEWTYEGAAFASGKTQYLPDFVAGEWYIEVKPYLDVDDNNPNDILDKMEVIYDGHPRAPYLTLAIASPCLGDLMFCHARTNGKYDERGIGGWFATPGEPTVPMEMFGDMSTDIAYWIADGSGPQHVDWGWK